MIKFIKYIIEYFNKNEKDNTIDRNKNEQDQLKDIKDAQENSFSFHFIVHEDEVEIYCDLSYDSNIPLSKISDLSEKYAQTLVSINYGIFKSKILESLTIESKYSEDTKKVLLIDNILSFYEIYKVEMMKNSVLYKKPLISPSSVFNQN